MGEDHTGGPLANHGRLTVAQAAASLGITEGAVRSRIKRGTLPTVKESGAVYILLGGGTSQANRTPNADVPGDRSALIEALRDQIEDLRRERDEWREQARVTDRLLSAAMERIPPQLEAPTKPRESPETGTVQTDSAEDHRNASVRGPQDTVFTTLVPLPRERTGERSTGRLFGGWMRSPLQKYLSYAIGIVLIAASAGLDFFYSPGGVDVSVRLFIAAAFGIYVGIKDGKKGQPVGRFNIIGALAGLLAWMVAAYVSQATLVAAYDRGDISPIVSSAFTYLLGTWLMFMSGFLIGKALQIKAEEDRGRPQDGSSPSGADGALAKGTRTTAIVGVVGVIVAALLQMLGQIVSALVGSSGP